MKLTKKQLKQIIKEEINSIFSINEGGAQQLIGQYNIQVITEDEEVITALDVIRTYVRRNAEYRYGIEEYKRVLEVIDEASSLMETVIDTKRDERTERYSNVRNIINK